MIDDIMHLWNQGLTLTQIARRLNTTRNVVAGKMHRAKLSGVEFEPRTAFHIRKAVADNTSARLDNQITRLRIDNCRFILNDDTSNPVYCCEPISRRSYCEAHALICYMPREKRR